jgi:hypothetical protein
MRLSGDNSGPASLDLATEVTEGIDLLFSELLPLHEIRSVSLRAAETGV